MLTPEQIATAALARTASGWHIAELTEQHMTLIVATAVSAVNADRAQRAKTVHNYEVGDPDDTPEDGPWCEAEHPARGFVCTRDPGHRGAHAAGDGQDIVAVWGA